MNMFWLDLAQAETEAEDSGAEFWANLVILGIYLLIGLAFVIGIIWALVSRHRRESQQDKFEDRKN